MEVRSETVALLDAARIASPCSVNALMTATYRDIGYRIAEVEQQGQGRVKYGQPSSCSSPRT